MAVSKDNNHIKNSQTTITCRQYTKGQQRVAVWGALLGLFCLAVDRTGGFAELSQPGLKLVPPVVAILFALWLPLADAVRWLRTGESPGGAITILLAIGASALGDLSDAGFMLCIWTLAAVLRARVFNTAARPLAVWETLAAGHWPDHRYNKSKKSGSSVDDADLAASIEVRPRDVVPCDGVVEQNPGLVSSLWNSLPARNLEPGDLVYAGDVNIGESLMIRPLRKGSASALARAAAIGWGGVLHPPRPSKTGRLLHLWSLCWSVLALLITAGAPFLLGSSARMALTRGLALLALTIPGTWQAAIELPVVAAVGAALRKGFVPKTGWVMEHIGRLGMLTLVWDVTFGRGRRLVADVLPVKPKACSPMQLLAIAAAVEVAAAVDDPVAEAIKYAAEKEGLSLPPASEGRSVYSEGAVAVVEGHHCLVGSERFMQDNGIDITPAAHVVQQLRNEECRPVYCAAGGYLLGALGISENDKQEWPRTAEQLHNLAVKLVVMNGNPEDGRSAWAPGHTEGMVSLLAGQEVPTLRSWSKSRAYVGVIADPVRDKDILGQADVGMAAGPEAAIEGTGHLLMMNGYLSDLPWAIKLGRRLRMSLVRLKTFAIVSRCALAAMVVLFGFGALEVVAIDAAAFVVVAVASLRLIGHEKIRLPHRSLAVERRKRSRRT